MQSVFNDLDNIYSLEGEAAVLGSMILDSVCIDKAMTLLAADDFYKSEHQTIFSALMAARAKGAEVDMVLLRDHLKKSGKLQEIGGVDYLVKLCESVPTTANLKYYAGIVKDKALNRDLIQKADEIKAIAESGDDPSEKMDQIQEIALSLNSKPTGEGITPVKDHLAEAYEGLEHATSTGLPTGFGKLDYQLHGLNKGDVIIVAARPSIGKTSFALNIAANIARKRKGIAFYTLEMTKTQLAQRLICSQARVSMQRAKQQDLQGEEHSKLTAAGNQIINWPIFISQQTDLTPEGLLASLRTLRRQHGIDCVVIDYLQLMNDPTVKENRVQQVTAISRKLKGIALQENLPLVVLSQLSRQTEHRDGRRPVLSDLRDSGAIEQDADIVIFLYRKAYYDPSADNTAEVIISKNRNGPTGIVKLLFHGEYVTFENISEYETV